MHTPKRTIELALALVMALALTSSLAACGRKGDIIPPGTVLPAPVNDLHAEPRAGNALLSWTMPSGNEDGTPLSDLAGFDILRAGLAEDDEDCDCVYSRVGIVDLDSPDGAVVKGGRVVWPDRSGSLDYGKRYGYRVVAFDTGGYRGTESNTASLVFLPPPPAPEALSAEPGDKNVRLSWHAVQADGAALAGYNVYRADSPGQPMTKPLNAQPVVQTSYTDTGMENGKKLVYRVTALIGSSPPYSEGPPSGEVSSVPVDNVAPEAPSGLQAVSASGGVLLSWLPSMDEDVAGYVLYRKGPEDGELKPLPGMPVKGITYKDTGVREGGEYIYAVSAVDGNAPPNESGQSGTVSATFRGN